MLDQPLRIEAESDMVVGYYQNLGVACQTANLRVIVEGHIRDGVVDWLDSEIEDVEPGELDEEIKRQVVPISGEGIWYRSGRVFHGPE